MTATRRWVVRSDPVDCGWHAWFYVYFYETSAQLCTAAAKYKYSDGDWHGTLGCFQPSLSIGLPTATKDTKKLTDVPRNTRRRTANTAFIGVMRLCHEALTPTVIIHECGHAAVNYVNALRLTHGYTLGNSNIATEEALCHALGEFSASLLNKLNLTNESPTRGTQHDGNEDGHA